jgi:hypothetical protein
MNKLKEHNYYKWSAKGGDYKRDDESTISYQRKIQTKKRIKIIVFSVLYFIAVSVVSYLVFTQI